MDASKGNDGTQNDGALDEMTVYVTTYHKDGSIDQMWTEPMSVWRARQEARNRTQ